MRAREKGGRRKGRTGVRLFFGGSFGGYVIKRGYILGDCKGV